MVVVEDQVEKFVAGWVRRESNGQKFQQLQTRREAKREKMRLMSSLETKREKASRSEGWSAILEAKRKSCRMRI